MSLTFRSINHYMHEAKDQLFLISIMQNIMQLLADNGKYRNQIFSLWRLMRLNVFKILRKENFPQILGSENMWAFRDH